MKARERGARVIHIDPHYSRTSAVADLHVPIRAGSDIAFLGGLIHHIIENEAYFKDYVVHYTNASMLVHEDFRDTEDLDGLFSGFDRETGKYDRSTWMFEGGDPDQVSGDDEQATQAITDRTGGQDTTEIPRDPTLQHPRCVFQVVRRHYSRYTPEMVERVCGIPPELFKEVADTLIANSGRDRTTMLAYAVGWTQHTAGVQIIRAGTIVQLLLGNVGRPGGGIMAMRGHASIQGSSDIPTLYEILPGYLPTPRAKEDDLTLEDYIDTSGRKKGWWSHFDAYIISLLKAWFGEAATAENGYGFSHLPKLTGNHSHFPTMLRALDGGLEGLLVMGQNPAVGSIHSGLQRRALGHLKWLVVRDLADLETASFWKDSPEIRSGEVKTEDIGTEVFLMPAATHVEKEGHFTNTQRLLQWRDKAIDPPGDARSGAALRLPPRPPDQGALRRLRPRPRLADQEPDLGLPRARPGTRAERGGGAPGDQRLRPRQGQARQRVRGAQVRRHHLLGLLDLRGLLRRRGQPDPPARSGRSRCARRLRLPRVGLGVARQPEDPLQPGVRRSRGQAVVRAQEVRLVGRGEREVDGVRRPGLPARQAARLRAGRSLRRDGRHPGRRVRSS
jgi:anaerobic selenocysteine-containing dehydrogenase